MNLYTIEARSKRMVRSDLLLIRLLSDALRRNIREISPETPSEHLGIVKNDILFKNGPTVTSLNINFYDSSREKSCQDDQS